MFLKFLDTFLIEKKVFQFVFLNHTKSAGFRKRKLRFGRRVLFRFFFATKNKRTFSFSPDILLTLNFEKKSVPFFYRFLSNIVHGISQAQTSLRATSFLSFFLFNEKNATSSAHQRRPKNSKRLKKMFFNIIKKEPNVRL